MFEKHQILSINFALLTLSKFCLEIFNIELNKYDQIKFSLIIILITFFLNSIIKKKKFD
jgi:hypothetical protein